MDSAVGRVLLASGLLVLEPLCSANTVTAGNRRLAPQREAGRGGTLAARANLMDMVFPAAPQRVEVQPSLARGLQGTRPPAGPSLGLVGPGAFVRTSGPNNSWEIGASSSRRAATPEGTVNASASLFENANRHP